MRDNSVAIVIPAFNESKTITDVICKVQIYGNVIIVDDGSTDSTIDTVKTTSATIISHKKNLGYEAALSTGFEYAFNNGYSYIVTTDADGELDSLAIPEVLKILRKNAMIVVCSRSIKNRIIETIFGALSGMFWGVSDPLCGMKGYSYNLFEKYGFFDRRKMIGTELLACALRDGIPINEVPIKVSKREGESRYGGALSSLVKITRIIFLFFLITYKKKD